MLIAHQLRRICAGCTNARHARANTLDGAQFQPRPGGGVMACRLHRLIRSQRRLRSAGLSSHRRLDLQGQAHTSFERNV